MSGTQADPLDFTQDDTQCRPQPHSAAPLGTTRRNPSVEIKWLSPEVDPEGIPPSKHASSKSVPLFPPSPKKFHPSEIIPISDDDDDVVFVSSGENVSRSSWLKHSLDFSAYVTKFRTASSWKPPANHASTPLSKAAKASPKRVPARERNSPVNLLDTPQVEQGSHASPASQVMPDAKTNNSQFLEEAINQRGHARKHLMKSARNTGYSGTRVLSFPKKVIQNPKSSKISNCALSSGNNGPSTLSETGNVTGEAETSLRLANVDYSFECRDAHEKHEVRPARDSDSSSAKTLSLTGMLDYLVDQSKVTVQDAFSPRLSAECHSTSQETFPRPTEINRISESKTPLWPSIASNPAETCHRGPSVPRSPKQNKPSHHQFSYVIGAELQETPQTSATVRSGLKRHYKHYEESVDFSTKDLMSRARRSLNPSIHSSSNTSLNLLPPLISLSPGASHQEGTSPFEDMKPIPEHAKSKSVAAETFQEKLYSSNAASNIKTQAHSIKSQLYRDQSIDLEEYTTYAGVKTNLLGENNLWLKAWPTSGERFDQEAFEAELHEFFEEKIPDARQKELPQIEKARQFKKFVSNLMEDLGLKIEDMINFLFRDDNLDGELDRVDAGALMESSKSIQRGSIQGWAGSVARSHKTTRSNMVTAGRLCAELWRTFRIPMWFIVKAMLHESNFVPKRDSQSPVPGENYSKMRCRICHLLECPFHGEFFERDLYDEEDADPSMTLNEFENSRVNDKWNVNCESQLGAKSDIPVAYHSGVSPRDFMGIDESGTITGTLGCNEDLQNEHSKSDRIQCSPSCFWTKSNRHEADTLLPAWSDRDIAYFKNLLVIYGYLKRGPCMMGLTLGKDCSQVFHMMLTLPPGKCEVNAGLKTKKPVWALWRKDLQKWKSNSLNNRSTFYPCNHENSCEEARCECYKQGIVCEKYCKCPVDCGRRFTGCSCVRRGKICWQNPRCPCFAQGRECDPDLCGTCGASEILSCGRRHDENITQNRCSNVNLQRNLQKCLRLGQSQVKGYGLYGGEDIKKDEFIGEYRGELLSNGESNRKGEVHQARARSYQFRLSAEENTKYPQIDGLRLSSKLRFINHASSPKFINCYPQPILCNTVIRLGMFACRDIEAGEELFFDYGYTEEHAQGFLEPDGTQSITTTRARGHPNPKFPKKINAPETETASKLKGPNLGKRKARESTASAMHLPEAAAESDSPTQDPNRTFNFKSDPEDDDYEEEEILDSSSVGAPISNESRIKRRRRVVESSSDL